MNTSSDLHTDSPTLAEVEQTVRDLLDDDAIVLTLDTRPIEVDGWDSLAHLNILFALEETFGIQMGDEEVAAMATVGDLVAGIDRARGLRAT